MNKVGGLGFSSLGGKKRNMRTFLTKKLDPQGRYNVRRLINHAIKGKNQC